MEQGTLSTVQGELSTVQGELSFLLRQPHQPNLGTKPSASGVSSCSPTCCQIRKALEGTGRVDFPDHIAVLVFFLT